MSIFLSHPIDRITRGPFGIVVRSDGTIDITGSLAPSTYSGNITITKTDPSIIFNAGQDEDTKFWLGVQDDDSDDDNDTFRIGKGTSPGTSTYFTLDKDGKLTLVNTLTVSTGGASITGVTTLESSTAQPLAVSRTGTINNDAVAFSATMESLSVRLVKLNGSTMWDVGTAFQRWTPNVIVFTDSGNITFRPGNVTGRDSIISQTGNSMYCAIATPPGTGSGHATRSWSQARPTLFLQASNTGAGTTGAGGSLGFGGRDEGSTNYINFRLRSAFNTNGGGFGANMALLLDATLTGSLTEQMSNIAAWFGDGLMRISGGFHVVGGRVLVPAPTTDVAPTPLLVHAAHSFPQAAAYPNQVGADLRLSGGIGTKTFTVVDFSEGTGDTLTVTINGTAHVLTEGVNFTAATNNATTATSIAAAVTALSGVTATAVSATVYITPAHTTYRINLVSGDAAFVGANNGEDGVLDILARDGAQSETGTLTNAPTAGNPTDWIVVKVNGILKAIPAWALS